jgi:hypothetical protein
MLRYVRLLHVIPQQSPAQFPSYTSDQRGFPKKSHDPFLIYLERTNRKRFGKNRLIATLQLLT